MWEPDIATVRLMLGLVGGTAAAGLAVLWWVNRGLPGLGNWLAAALLSMLADFLPPAVLWPRPELGVVANCALTLAALILLLDGILRFQGVGDPGRGHGPVVLSALGAAMVILVSAGRPGLQVPLHDLLAALLLAACLPALVWRTSGLKRLVSTIIGMAALGLSALFVWRAAETALGRAGQGPAAGWLLLAVLCWSLVWTFGCAVLVHLRVLADLGNQLERDPLTGLASRSTFMLRANAALQAAAAEGTGVGLLLTDINGLRWMNERLGHAAGDRLLVAFASRLRAAAGPCQVAARLGGDEFALLLPSLAGRAELLQAAERVHAAAAGPIRIKNNLLTLSFGIGTALHPEDGGTVESLLEAAHQAMGRMKALNTQASSR